MKTALTLGLTLCLPFLLSAQQKGTTPQDLQKQMNELRMEMQAQISLLQDSILSLQKQLNQQQEEMSRGSNFFYQNPFPGEMDLSRIQQDDLLSGRSWNYEVPDVPYKNYRMLIPLSGDDYLYDLRQLEVPPCPKPPKEKHKHEWMKMLPFGNLF